MNNLSPDERRAIYEEERRKLAAEPAAAVPVDETFGYLLLIVPFVSALLMYFWVGSMRLIDGPASSLSLLGMGTILATAVIAALEASRLEFGKSGKKESSPVAIFFGMALLWIFVYPAYFHMRAKKGRKNLMVGGIFVTVVFCLVWYLVGSAIDSAAQNLQKMFG